MGYKKLNSIIKKFIIVVFLYGLTSASFNGFFGIYIKELGYPESFVGSILSLRRFSVAVFTLIIAMITDKIGHKKMLIVGLFTVGISSIAIVMVENIAAMRAIAIVFGFGQSAMLTVESPFIYEQTDLEERVHAFSLTFATRNAAFVTGSLVTGLLADSFSKIVGEGAVSIRYALIVISAMSLLAIFPLAMLKPRKVNKHKSLNLTELKGFFNKSNIAFLSYTGFIGLGAGLVVPFFGVYLKYVLETTESVVGLILSFAQLGTVFGSLAVPFLSTRVGNHKTIVMTQLLSIPLLIAIGFPQGIIIVTISFFLRSSLMNMNQPLIRNISMDIVEENFRPLMSAMRAMINNLMRALGIFLGGIIMEAYTYNTPYLFTILFYLIGTYIFFRLFKDEIVKKKIA